VLMRGWVLLAETVSLEGLSHSMVEYVMVHVLGLIPESSSFPAPLILHHRFTAAVLLPRDSLQSKGLSYGSPRRSAASLGVGIVMPAL
jgi:hypothetical protein